MYRVMPFGLKNAPVVFSRIMVNAFKDFIHDFLEVYVDDWIIYVLVKDHVQTLRMMLNKCRSLQISLNLKKCMFVVPFGTLLEHIIYKEGLIVDPLKVRLIFTLQPPKTTLEVKTFLGYIGYNRNLSEDM